VRVDVIADIPKPDGVLVATVATTEVLFNASGKPSKDAILKPYEGSSIFDKTLETAQDSYSSLMKEAQSPEQSFGSEVVANDVARDKQNFIVNGSIPSIQDFKKVETGIEDEIKPSVAKEKEGMKTKELKLMLVFFCVCSNHKYDFDVVSNVKFLLRQKHLKPQHPRQLTFQLKELL